MADINIPEMSGLPPVRIHFSDNFPTETRGVTSNEEPVVIEITKVEYSLEECGGSYDITFYISGIKAFSISDDDQECFIKWSLERYDTSEEIATGTVSTGCIEMGERFEEKECAAPGIIAGDYTFRIIYV